MIKLDLLQDLVIATAVAAWLTLAAACEVKLMS